MEDLKNNELIRQYIAWNEYGRLLGMDFTIPQAGEVIYEMTIKDLHLATPFAAHGGSVASLMDAALGVAALSKVCTTNRIVATVTITINYMRPALNNDHLTAHARVVKSGKSLLFVECSIMNQNEALVANGSAVMNAYPLEKANYGKDV
jgi:uncharacterized protein (TIGR00369 family)